MKATTEKMKTPVQGFFNQEIEPIELRLQKVVTFLYSYYSPTFERTITFKDRHPLDYTKIISVNKVQMVTYNEEVPDINTSMFGFNISVEHLKDDDERLLNNGMDKLIHIKDTETNGFKIHYSFSFPLLGYVITKFNKKIKLR